MFVLTDKETVGFVSWGLRVGRSVGREDVLCNSVRICGVNVGAKRAKYFDMYSHICMYYSEVHLYLTLPKQCVQLHDGTSPCSLAMA